MPSADPVSAPALSQSASIKQMLSAIEPLLLSFVDQAEFPGNGKSRRSPFDFPQPNDIQRALTVGLPDRGRGVEGVSAFVEAVLQNSTNTWSQGFMSKLYGSTDAVGVASEMVLAFLNTNVHTYSVSPALTHVEKTVGRRLAGLFGFNGPYAGGITQTGGSGANLTALVTARNAIFPESKVRGIVAGKQNPVLFTSAHGHYSFEKAANVCGLGSAAAVAIAVDDKGCMIPADLERQIKRRRDAGDAPFFVNATAGTTVLGSYEPLEEIGEICAREGLWFHVDASWGGPAIFSEKHGVKLRGSHLADSITTNPHKMLGAPVICSFLLAKDLRRMWQSNTLPAPYLFHASSGANGSSHDAHGESPLPNGSAKRDAAQQADSHADSQPSDLPWDLADLTLQCGRRGDALKLAMGWEYYGFAGYRARIDGAFATAARLAELIAASPQLQLVSENPPPCLQVCFYAAPDGQLGASDEANSATTKRLAAALLGREFHVDFAPGKRGLFLRAVCCIGTTAATVERLVREVEAAIVAERGRQ